MRRQFVAIAAAICATAALGFSTPAWAQEPQGNSGTVKIDGVPFDDFPPNNQPHVDCTFEVEFYGFDADTEDQDLQAVVIFQHWPPTGDEEVLLTDIVDIGEDAAGGGTGLDATAEYTLEFGDAEPHHQGFHVRLTIHAEVSQGADMKHKVFWVQPCPPETTTTTTPMKPERPPTTTPVAPTKVPAGADGDGGFGAPPGLLLATIAAVAGLAMLARRRFLNDS